MSVTKNDQKGDFSFMESPRQATNSVKNDILVDKFEKVHTFMTYIYEVLYSLYKR